MNKKPARPCEVCLNSKSAEILHRQSFILPQGHILEKAREYDIVSCNECGFVYADTPLKQKTYDSYYEKMSKYELDYSKADISRYMSQAKLIKSFLPHENLKVIDVGCGNGGLLMALKQLGQKNITALDPSVKCISNIKKAGIKGFTGNLFGNTGAEKYDMVILSHVMEHVKDVSRALDKVLNMLNENGMLYIEVPDASSYADNHVVPYYYFDTEHINHFEETSLINLGMHKGLRVINLGKKLIDASARVKYPAIYVLYKRTAETASWNSYAKARVKAYIKLSAADKKVLGTIDELLKIKKKIVIWGAGNYTMRLLDNSPLANCDIEAFIDKDPKKQGLKINGKPVLSTDIIGKLSPDTVIVICSAVYADEITAELKGMKVKNRIVTL